VATRNSQATFAKLVHHAITLAWFMVAVQTVGGIALRLEMIHQLIHHAFGVAEN